MILNIEFNGTEPLNIESILYFTLNYGVSRDTVFYTKLFM